MKRLGIDDTNSFKGKRVFLRVDFNVPLNEKGEITDDKRIRSSLKSIQYLLHKGAALILASHMGRPKGTVVPSLSLETVARHLKDVCDLPVVMAPDCIGEEVERMVRSLKSGEILLLENLRFHKEETKNDSSFSKKLSRLADCYVNDAFGTVHRSHSSTEGMAHFFEERFAGFLFQKEFDYFSKLLADPPRPFLAILGGANVSDKILLIENLIQKVDALILGGGMSYTFFLAQGIPIGESLVERDQVELAKNLMEKAKNIKFFLPFDHVIADSFSADAQVKITEKPGVPDKWEGLDIGPKSVARFSEVIRESKSVLWNGPVGVFEWEAFSQGTRGLAEMLSKSSAMTVIGGGDTAAAIHQFGLEESMDHISTGGGASLEFMEGKTLPGLSVLE